MPKEIAESVIAMMAKVGYIQKTGFNDFHKYKYVSIEGVLEKVQPALTDCGLVITQDEMGHAIIADGNLMEATYAFSLSHKSGKQWGPIRHTGLASVRNTKGGYDDKALNKCHTAARKYFILGLFQIPTGLEADADEEEDKPEAARPQGQQRTAAPQPKNGKTTAAGWALESGKKLETFKTEKQLDDWISSNTPTLNRLRENDAVLADELDGKILERRGHIKESMLAAG
jgi:hypothetical protein